MKVEKNTATKTSPCYGTDFLRTFLNDTDTSPLLKTSSLPKQQIEAMHVVIGKKQLGLTVPLPRSDTFAVAVSLTEVSRFQTWKKGQIHRTEGFAQNALQIEHQDTDTVVRIFEPNESIVYAIPRVSLDAFTDREGYGRVHTLSSTYGVVDPTMAHLTQTLFPYFRWPLEASPLFLDLLELTITAHLVHRYSDSRSLATGQVRGYLSTDQVRKVQEMLADDLEGNLRVADIARICDISPERLIRMYKRTTGYTPYQWLQRERIGHARNMLKDTKLSISEIALQCGFKDQSHLTRIFRRFVQITPAIWRRHNKN